MMRTQIQLHEDDHSALKRFAANRGISLSEAVRRAVRLLLERQAPTRDDLVREALSVAGRYGDPDNLDDVATDHDRHLDEAFGP